jgi:hypothetical protein
MKWSSSWLARLRSSPAVRELLTTIAYCPVVAPTQLDGQPERRLRAFLSNRLDTQQARPRRGAAPGG